MESETITLNSYVIECYSVNTLIIGSGAASLNAAVSLHSMDQKDILIATSQWGGGTSNNAGSDKQTYYKLSLSGSSPDSVMDMARDLFNGKCMHGDIALCEAQGSVQAFIRLVNMGIQFPHDKYGSWPGYKTDHDPRGRATSAGPYTSREIFKALASEVRKREIRILDNHQCVALLTDKKGSKVIGALAINTDEKDYHKAFVLFNSTNVILGTGGPGGMYETSVYPLSQEGSTGMAFVAGASGQNLTETQFGIASIRFRWNLSGSYQQSIPRYVSTDKAGNDEKEFLNDYFPDLKTLCEAIFLKGYQWPFDPRKISGNGSSMIDLLVHNEINEKKRRVFLDYRRNPSKGKKTFSVESLGRDSSGFLKRSNAIKNTPFERLSSLNLPAIDLFKEHGIDLAKEPLEIAVCAQHNNGGLKAGIWWESDLPHLFPVGEVNGTHGVYRPGGSALNSGQVGSFRAAQFIKKNYNIPPEANKVFLEEVKECVFNNLGYADRWISRGKSDQNKIFLSEIRNRMSSDGGIIRDSTKVRLAVEEAKDLLTRLPVNIGASNVGELAEAFQQMDHCISHYIYLNAINFYIENAGRSRGSFIVSQTNNQFSEFLSNPELCNFDRKIENKILEVGYKNQKINLKLQKVREIPKQDLWFEKVWREYLEDIFPR